MSGLLAYGQIKLVVDEPFKRQAHSTVLREYCCGRFLSLETQQTLGSQQMIIMRWDCVCPRELLEGRSDKRAIM